MMPSAELKPAILQQNNGDSWVTLAAVGEGGEPYNANVLAGKRVVYVLAYAMENSSAYVNFATIGMNGGVTHASGQPACNYPGSTFGTYDMYAYDIALNKGGNSVFMNPDIAFPGSKEEFGWTFVSTSGEQSECYLVNVGNGGNIFVLASGPKNTIWGLSSGDYLWRFSSNGSSKHFSPPPSVTGFESLVEGPDHVMWAQPYNTQTVVRIDPDHGTVLSTYNVPCALPAYALTVASGLVWGYADGCVYSISPSGHATKYPVNDLLAQDSAHAIAAGPDGDPWFIDRNNGNELGTVNRQTGYPTIVSLPYGASYGVALGTGPDKNLWVMDENYDVYVYTPSPLSVSPTSVTLQHAGDTAQLTVTEVGTTSWNAASQDSQIATVKKTATKSVFTVKAVGPGYTTVTVKDKVGNSVAISVTVE
jgi:hypothetical protein